jgi:hypothetical protein
LVAAFAAFLHVQARAAAAGRLLLVTCVRPGVASEPCWPLESRSQWQPRRLGAAIRNPAAGASRTPRALRAWQAALFL